MGRNVVRQIIFRSYRNGQFVTESYALSHPSIAKREVVLKPKGGRHALSLI